MLFVEVVPFAPTKVLVSTFDEDGTGITLANGLKGSNLIVTVISNFVSVLLVTDANKKVIDEGQVELQDSEDVIVDTTEHDVLEPKAN